MIKKSLIKIIKDNDLKESCFNFTSLYFAGKLASVVSSAFFDFNLNKYNSVEHLAIGAGIGTLAYRKAGGGVKGVFTGLAAATLFSFGWEVIEHNLPNYRESLEDTLSDIAVVYIGSALGFFGENFKNYLNRH